MEKRKRKTQRVNHKVRFMEREINLLSSMKKRKAQHVNHIVRFMEREINLLSSMNMTWIFCHNGLTCVNECHMEVNTNK